ncbi:MAG TPA: hypothetical protein VK821_06630 [Dehalococcoidia bacterium]|nr:hypothetical protein [Dehalococcoidia bacterium]
MILSTGSTRSTLGASAKGDLIGREILPPWELNQYTLTDVRLGEQAISDLQVRITRQSPIWTDVDGMLGLDFLTQFTEIRFEVPTLRLTLTLP